MNNNLRKFNQLNNASYDRLTIGVMPWQDVFATNKPKEEANIDRLWETVARNIAYEQAIKEVQQEVLNRETVRMIKELEEYDKARKIGRNPSDRTEIQGSYEVPSQPNEIADNDEHRTQVNDDNLYAANALPYVQGGVRLGTWRRGNPSQYVAFASDLLQPKGIGDVLTGEWSYVMDSFGNHGDYQYDSDAIPAPMVGIDNIEGYEEELLQFVKSHQGEIETVVKAAVNTAQAQAPFDIFQFVMTKVPMPPNGKAFMITALFILALCQCAQTASQKKPLNVRIYMAKHNCSQEEAEAHISYFDLLFAEVGTVLTEEWVAETLHILGIPKKIAGRLTYLCFAVLKMFDEYRRILQKELYYL